MIKDKFGQIVYEQDEVLDILMHDTNAIGTVFKPGPFTVELTDDEVLKTNDFVGYEALQKYTTEDETVEEFDAANQADWWMPESYRELDIAAHILDLCNTDAELQRCGEELLLYAERDLLDLLRYMNYLEDTMELKRVIWGVGRGSSVSSYVLYLLKVHKIDSMFYKLDVREFLR